MLVRLLGGASALALGLLVVGTAVAQPNDANNNQNSAITQEASGDAVAGANAVENGALAGYGNAAGEFSEDNALANNKSATTHIDADGNIDALATDGSIAVDDGGLVKRNGAALGDDANDNAVVGGHGTAINAGGDVADEGSSAVTGHGSQAASASQGGASIVGDGTAIGIHDVTVGSGFFNGPFSNSNGSDFGAGDDATAAFGVDNVIASAHLNAEVTGLAVAVDLGRGRGPVMLANGFENGIVNGDGKDGRDGKKKRWGASIETGFIGHNSVESMTGANRVVFNTGIANQGRALAVAGDASFNGHHK